MEEAAIRLVQLKLAKTNNWNPWFYNHLEAAETDGWKTWREGNQPASKRQFSEQDPLHLQSDDIVFFSSITQLK